MDPLYRSELHIKKFPNLKHIFSKVLIIVVLFIITLMFLPWQQFAIGSGRVIAFSPTERRHTINTPISGRIKKWYVNEGMHVSKGDRVVTISDNDPQLLDRLDLEKKAVFLEIDAFDKSLKASERNLIRQKNLYEQGISSRRQYELAEIEYAKYQNDLAKARIDLINVNIKISRQKTQVITAHVDGIFYKRLAGENSLVVKTGQVLAEIIPDTQSRVVALMIDGNDIPFLKVGQIARIQFEGWPAVQTPGWPSLAVGTFGGRVTFIDPTDNGTGFFRVVISPIERWPSLNYLRQGVMANGWVQLGKVPLWFEIWRQINGYPPESVKNTNKFGTYNK
jgi:multidrug efflux pump subunit AcrA (membrane-fusion protein)